MGSEIFSNNWELEMDPVSYPDHGRLSHVTDLDHFDIMGLDYEEDMVDRSRETRSTKICQSVERRASSSTTSQRSFRNPDMQGQKEMNPYPTLLADVGLGGRTSRFSMTDGLLRIYHDSMEHALSCWLTDHNCPYIMAAQIESLVISPSKNATDEWGASWSNKMYNRVIQLDRAYKSIRSRLLTAEEERTVSKALNMAVVAFASQWAQAGDRGMKRQYQSTGSGLAMDDIPESNSFERTMQETLWHQTSQLLHQAASIDSFRVVFALLLFSLTQRPLDMTDPAVRSHSVKMGYESFRITVQDEEAPIFLEIALRQILSQRRKLEHLERENVSRGIQCGDPLEKEERGTFNLLYWLGVMFDTLSAAMCHRAFVIEDDDCELPRPSEASLNRPTLSGWENSPEDYVGNEYTATTNLDAFIHISKSLSPEQGLVWGDLFIRNNHIHSNSQAIRWPCSYQDAASTLSSAAPVKVLLFRRVARLQTLVSRRASALSIESAIKATFHVYNYWHRVYNPFITDCVDHHNELPARVQSWYIILAGHWHLAAFLLSDLLSTIDTMYLSLPSERATRQTSDIISKLRRQNAVAVAKLSRASVHASPGGVQDFHFALNQATLLTEPWTVVLVRSLCRAGYILAEIASMDPNEQNKDQARRRCGDCIEGLWNLGRKSDMAFLAARALSDILEEREQAAAVPVVPYHPTTNPTAHMYHSGMESSRTNAYDNGAQDTASADSFDMFPPIADPIDIIQQWSTPDDIESSVLGNWIPGSDTSRMEANVAYEKLPFVDTGLQQQVWGR